MKHDFIRRLEFTQKLLEMKKNNILAEYMENQREALERIYEGKPYILCTYYIPSEFTALFQVECLYLERIVGIAVGTHIVTGQEETEEKRIGCSYHQTMLKLIQRKILPLPDRILCFEYPCQNCVDLCTYLHEQYKIPIDYIKQESLTEQLVSLYQKLKSLYGLKQTIRETVRLSNKAVRIKSRIDCLRREYPGVISSDFFLKIFTIENDFGTQMAVNILTCIMSELENKTEGFQEDNKFRIFWMGLIPLTNNNMLSSMERKLPVSFIYEEMWMFGEYYITEAEFFDDLANKIQKGFFYDNKKRIQMILDTIHATKAKAVINLTQKRCSFLPPLLNDVHQAIKKEGIPFLNVTTDVILEQYEEEKLKEVIIYLENYEE